MKTKNQRVAARHRYAIDGYIESNESHELVIKHSENSIPLKFHASHQWTVHGAQIAWQEAMVDIQPSSETGCLDYISNTGRP